MLIWPVTTLTQHALLYSDSGVIAYGGAGRWPFCWGKFHVYWVLFLPPVNIQKQLMTVPGDSSPVLRGWMGQDGMSRFDTTWPTRLSSSLLAHFCIGSNSWDNLILSPPCTTNTLCVERRSLSEHPTATLGEQSTAEQERPALDREQGSWGACVNDPVQGCRRHA